MTSRHSRLRVFSVGITSGPFHEEYHSHHTLTKVAHTISTQGGERKKKKKEKESFLKWPLVGGKRQTMDVDSEEKERARC